MELNINGEIVKIENYRPLDDRFDQIIHKLYEKYFINKYQAVNNLLGSFLENFDKELIDYFGRNNNSKKQDDAFTALALIFHSYINLGLIDEAQKLWERILLPVRYWEEENKSQIHKGSIYYFWAQPAILKGDIDLGFFLIHQAAEEDKRTSIRSYIGLPAHKTATLNYLDSGQYLYNFVCKWRDFLKTFLENFNKGYSKCLSLELFNKKFLTFLPISEFVYSFSHNIAKASKLADTPPFIIESNFASVYEMNLIFDLILVVDSILFFKVNSNWRYFALAKKLLARSSLNLSDQKNSEYLSEISDLMKRDPDGTINKLLDDRITFSDGYKPVKGECDIYLSYCLRNYSAHNIQSITSIWQRFWEIYQSILNVLFLSVDVFY